MKKLMRGITISITTAAILTIAIMEAATPTGARAQTGSRCTGDSEPICAIDTECAGFLGWKRCITTYRYWELSPLIEVD